MKQAKDRSGVAFSLPWPPTTLSPNKRQHFMALSRAKKAYRETCYLSVLAQRILVSDEPCISVELQFCPPNKHKHDIDNLVARMKSGLDGVADALGVNDRTFHLAAPLIGAVVKGGCVWVRLTAKDT